MARTWKVCSPGRRSVYCSGDEQLAKGSPSSEHSNSAPTSFEEKLNVASVYRVVAAGVVWIVVSGGVVSSSTVHV
jgi:hypothetical protein